MTDKIIDTKCWQDFDLLAPTTRRPDAYVPTTRRPRSDADGADENIDEGTDIGSNSYADAIANFVSNAIGTRVATALVGTCRWPVCSGRRPMWEHIDGNTMLKNVRKVLRSLVAGCTIRSCLGVSLSSGYLCCAEF